jgi:heavy metal translocating P-type ATPase
MKQWSLATWVASIDALVLLAWGVMPLVGFAETRSMVAMVALVLLALPLWIEIIRDMMKGHFGVDLIAGLAIVGAWLLNESLAGLVIILMLSGGQALEAFAMRKAHAELTRLLARAPSVATKKTSSGYEMVPVDHIVPEDVVMVKSGEVIPVDGVVVEGESLVDESSITGESVPVEKKVGSFAISGTENTNSVIHIKAEKRASESRYASIVRLVKNAQDSRAPMVRLADRYAVVFTGITLLLAGLSYAVFQEPIRALAVLVVATPCPLILATPIAIISGMSRAAKRGVIVKDGGALETLSRVKTVLLDKTGTLTLGTPTVGSVVAFSGEEDIVALAASLDQGSSHILARSLVSYAHERSVVLEQVEGFKEVFGEGVEGIINGTTYRLGKLSYLQHALKLISDTAQDFYTQQKNAGGMTVFLAKEDHIVGAIAFTDEVRSDADEAVKMLEQNKVTVAMVTGDHEVVAQKVAASVGIRVVHADCQPEEKLALVSDAVAHHGPVAMIGDGVNDAPALARADVGIAVADHGDTASSEAASMVVIKGSLQAIADTYALSRMTIRIAQQGIIVGMSLSIIAMIVAALGYLDPLPGALLQEGIDVVVILGALRVLIAAPDKKQLES